MLSVSIEMNQRTSFGFNTLVHLRYINTFIITLKHANTFNITFKHQYVWY